MLMTLGALIERYDMRIDGVLHVGAHLAEEADTYQAAAAGRVWWVEANPSVRPYLKSKLKQYPGHKLINALVYSEDGVDLDFHVTNLEGMSSSILEFGTHTRFSPDIVFVETLTLPTRTIDSVVKKHKVEANFLNMDIQGAELHALQGATQFLQGVDYVMTEVNSDEVYKKCAKVEQLDHCLHDYGLERVETYWVPDQGWGDALYVRAT